MLQSATHPPMQHFLFPIRSWLLLILFFILAFIPPARARDFATVIRVVDGDTLEIALQGKTERVQLIGVDTPEYGHPKKPTEHFGKEASAFTRRCVEGKQVRLAFDPANAATDHKDNYRRTLAYVYLSDGSLLNYEIIHKGYGTVSTRFPFAHLEEFRAAEREARDTHRGLWKTEE